MSSPDARPLLSGWPVLQIASTMQVFSYFTQLFRIMDWGLAYIDFVNSFIAVLAILFSGTTLPRTLWLPSLWPGPSPGSHSYCIPFASCRGHAGAVCRPLLQVRTSSLPHHSSPRSWANISLPS